MLCFGVFVVWWKGEIIFWVLVLRDEEGIKLELVFLGFNW